MNTPKSLLNAQVNLQTTNPLHGFLSSLQLFLKVFAPPAHALQQLISFRDWDRMRGKGHGVFYLQGDNFKFRYEYFVLGILSLVAYGTQHSCDRNISEDKRVQVFTSHLEPQIVSLLIQSPPVSAVYFPLKAQVEVWMTQCEPSRLLEN